MAVNIVVYPLTSPRVVEITTPQTEATVQDLHDAIREWEDSEAGMSFPYLIETAGGEELGGGVTVGLTSKLLNAQVYFPPRSTPITFGETCSSDDAQGRVLVASGATFQTDGLVRGDVIYNGTTGAMTPILSVDSEEQITHLPLTGGARNDWQIGDAVIGYHNPQCSISGGNLVAVDENGDDIPPVLNSPLAQVVRTASSSATLQELQDIQYSSFNGGISYDETSPYSGTDYPVGTPRQPVNNAVDAMAIAAERGFTTGFIISDMTAPTEFALTGFTFVGSGKDRTEIILPDAATISECTFIDAKVTGYLDGDCSLKECLIEDLYYIKGYVEQCVLAPGITVLAGSGVAYYLDCWCGSSTTEVPTIDCGGGGQGLVIRNFNGCLKLTNKTGPEIATIDLNSGMVRVDMATVTNGTLRVAGIGKLVDDATDEHVHSGTYGSLQVVNETINNEEMAHHTWLDKKALTVAKFLGLK